MNLDFDFQNGPIEYLRGVLERMTARINTVWKKEHDATTGGHTHITAESIDVSGDATIGGDLTVGGESSFGGSLSITGVAPQISVSGLSAGEASYRAAPVGGQAWTWGTNDSDAGLTWSLVRGSTVAGGTLELSVTSSGLTSFGSIDGVNRVQSTGDGTTDALITSVCNSFDANSAVLRAQIAPTGTGDAKHQALINAGNAWSWGLDNSDSDAWKLSGDVNLGTGDAIRVARTSFQVQFSGGIRPLADNTVENGATGATWAKTFGGVWIGREIAPASLAASQNDYSPTGLSTAYSLALTASTPVNITGLDATGIEVGRPLLIGNYGVNNITLVHASGSSAANNQFFFHDGANRVLATGGVMQVVRLPVTNNRWVNVRS